LFFESRHTLKDQETFEVTFQQVLKAYTEMFDRLNR